MRGIGPIVFVCKCQPRDSSHSVALWQPFQIHGPDVHGALKEFHDGSILLPLAGAGAAKYREAGRYFSRPVTNGSAISAQDAAHSAVSTPALSVTVWLFPLASRKCIASTERNLFGRWGAAPAC